MDLKPIALYGFAPGPRPDGRSAYLDNAKALLIILVVYGHLGFSAAGHRGFGALNLLIYSFHMPAFALVSGMLTKANTFSPKGLRSLGRLVAGYLFFQSLNTLWLVFGTGVPFSVVRFLTVPEPSMWWFLSLIGWRLLLPLFALGSTRRDAVISIAVAVAIAVAAGSVFSAAPHVLSIMRTCVFLPFFVAGYRIAQQDWHLPRNWKMRIDALALMLAAFLVLLSASTFANINWFFGRVGYPALHASLLGGSAKRLILLAASGILVSAFLQLVPRRPLVLSHLGASTLSVFGWHYLIIRIAEANGYTQLLRGDFLHAVVTTLVLVVALGYGPLAWLTMRMFTGPGKPVARG